MNNSIMMASFSSQSTGENTHKQLVHATFLPTKCKRHQKLYHMTDTWKLIALRTRGNRRFRRKTRASTSKMESWKILWSSAVSRSKSCNVNYCRGRSTKDQMQSRVSVGEYDHLQSSRLFDAYDHSNSDIMAEFFKKTLFLHHNIPPQTKEGILPKQQENLYYRCHKEIDT